MSSQCDLVVLEDFSNKACTTPKVFSEELAKTLNLTNASFAEVAVEDCFSACEIAECSASDEFDPIQLLYTVSIQVLVFMLVFGLAGSVEFDHFKERIKSRGIKIGLFCQFFLMPAIGFATVAMFLEVLDPLYAITLLIICSSPGGSYSNWWCNLINADLALSVAMTTVSTLLSLAMLPLNIYLYVEIGYKTLSPENAQEVVKLLPFEVIGYTLAVVISAVVLGITFGVNYPQYMGRVNKIGTFAGFVSIALGAFASSTSCAPPWGQDILLYIAVAVPVFAGLGLAMGAASLANLPKPQRVAVSLETAYQNTGIALAVSLALGPSGRAAAVIPVVYGGYEAVVFGVFCVLMWYIGWTLSPADESFCVTIFADHQHSIKSHPYYKGYHGDDGADIEEPKDHAGHNSNQVTDVAMAVPVDKEDI